VTVKLSINGRRTSIEGSPIARLLDVLREQCELPGTKEGCGEGECGACTVLLNGEPVLSCLVPVLQCEGVEVTTVEGLEEVGAAHFLEEVVASGGVQCGAGTPGVVVTAWALLRRNSAPTRAEMREYLAGNLCRCTGYEGIYRALERSRK